MSFVPAIILSCLVIVAEASLYDFIYVGECVLGYNPFVLLLKHGCYCGFGNFGENVTAEDGYDQCCKDHDKCYGDLVTESHECSSTLQEYFSPYTVDCPLECTPTCHVPFPFILFPSVVKCSMGLCRCDIKMMECWRNVQWSSEKNGARPDKRICKNGGENSTTGVPKEGTWLEKLFIYLEFKSNMQRAKYLKTNKIEDLPEFKCRKYANVSYADSNKIPPLHAPSKAKEFAGSNTDSNEILPPHSSPKLKETYDNYIERHIVPYN